MRRLPTAFLFHIVTHLLFESLATEIGAVRNLEQYYVVRVPAKIALEFAGLGRDNSFLYFAEWWYRGTKTS